MSSGVTKLEMQAFCRVGGLEVTGKETFEELSEAVINLVQTRRRLPKGDSAPPRGGLPSTSAAFGVTMAECISTPEGASGDMCPLASGRAAA